MNLTPMLVSLFACHRRWLIAASGLLAFSAINCHAATGTLTSLAADAQANSDGTVTSGTVTFARLGADSGVRHSVLHVFQIPASVLNDPTQRFSAATYTIKLGSGAVMTHNGDLYGLPYRASATVVGTDFYEGVSDPAAVMIQDNFMTPATPNNSVLSTSGSNLTDYLNNVLVEARTNGATSAYVVLRLSLDSYQWSNNYVIGMSEGPVGYVPKIDYTTQTADAWREVPLGGGGRVTGLMSDAAGNTIYCRTDVGGFFRWVPAPDGNNGHWKSISDKMFPFQTSGVKEMMNGESLAIDPNNPNRIYVAAGSSTMKGIFTSTNRGDTWSQINSTIITNGNASFRAAGERAAVDPNDSSVLWYGSGLQGLQKGVQSGTTWTWTQVSATSVPVGSGTAGVTFVVCDKNSPGQTIVYAGVYHPTDGGIYRSPNAGTSWGKVPGPSFTTPIRAQLAPNGTLYITGGTQGVAKLPRGGSLSVLSSTSLPALNYMAVAVDPNNANGDIVYIAENKTRDGTVLRSENGGLDWSNQAYVFNGGPVTPTNHQRMEPDGLTPTLTGYWWGATAALLVNPANSKELWLADFFGVARTRDADLIGTNPGAWWYMLQRGQEETVVLDTLNAPTGARLVSGLGDVGGSTYLDTNVRPYGAGGYRMRGPHEGNVTSLDFSEGNPNMWARTWIYQNATNSPGTGAYSTDGGVSWLPFGQLATRVVTGGTSDGWETWDVGPYISKLKASGTASSVTLVVSSGNTPTYSTASLSFYSREAANSSLQPRLVVNGGTPIYASADTYVDGAAQTTNSGTDSTLQVRYSYSDKPQFKRWSYLRFDLSSVPAITSAELQLCRIGGSSGVEFPVGVYATTNPSWAEGNGGTDGLPAGEVRWDNAPKALTNTDGDPQLFNYYAGSVRLSGGRIAVSATDPDNLVWMPISGTMHYSVNRGASWSPSVGAPVNKILGVYGNGSSSTEENGQPLAADRGNGYFYAVNFSGSFHSVYRSTNGGKNWTQVSTINNGGTFNFRSPQIVAAPPSPACPNGGDVWVCDDNEYNNSASGGGLWRSIDSASSGSWVKIAGVSRASQVSFGKSQSGVGYTVFVHGTIANPQSVYVKGIYRSDDYGLSWSRLADPTINEILTLNGDRQNFGKVFIGTGGRGIFQWP